jgi:hypothetical protein
MTDIIHAIKSINPNAEVMIISEDYNQINWLNGTAPISIEDIKAKQAELKIQYEAKEQAKIDAKTSGNQKLLDLGLTQAEATALTGYTPPTEV